jgi:hypothetical protein
MIRNIVIFSLVAGTCLAAEQGATISRSADLDTVYQAVLNQVKKDGAEIESASKDAGIKTAVTVTGHYKQTGSYLEITFISDSPSQTSVRVAAYEEKRYKGLKTEPWSTPKVNAEQSEAEAAKLKQELGW